MLRPYVFFVRIAVLASCVLPFGMLVFNATLTHRRMIEETATWPDLGLKLGVLLAICVPVCALILIPRRKWLNGLERASEEQAKFIDSLPLPWVDVAIVGSASISLLVELSLIRWQGDVFEVFAFYKNFGLLACFLGLGLGYALAARPQIPLLMAVPLLAWQFIVLTITRQGHQGWNVNLLRALPVKEQLHMGFSASTPIDKYLAVLWLLIIVFLLTALALMPVGQLCGRLLDRRAKLRAYGFNLLGSLLGVVLLFVFSLLWTGPIVWFGVAFAALLVFQSFNIRALLLGSIASVAGLITLAWPVFLWEQIHSPYQLLERGPDEFGLSMLRASGHYFQRINDFTACERDPNRRWIFEYYAFPYRVVESPGRVAVVGAGTGNDVAMAIRMGAEHVDAIEIDPAIMAVGAKFHPDHPYGNPKVRRIVNDARSFLRTTNNTYNMIIYGLLDSHTLLSHGSNVRLDSFVYTVEAFREAREKLVDGGVLSLAFCVLSPEQGRKIYLMLEEAFDGTPPVCVAARYDGAVIFLERKNRPFEIPPNPLNNEFFKDVTSRCADPSLHADVSTDDWPFFYMPRRVYPLSYVAVLSLLVLFSAVLVAPFFPARPHFGQVEFFLLGAGFMLVETKSITELGLTFGNTWYVIGIVISGILLMAFLANLVVMWLKLRKLAMPYVLLVASLMLGVVLMNGGGFDSTPMGRALAVVVLTCPLFFSGIVFSTLLQSSDDVSGAMASNLIGAMLGGVLEYNSMYFGFLFLYWIAIAIYAVAFLTSILRLRTV